MANGIIARMGQEQKMDLKEGIMHSEYRRRVGFIGIWMTMVVLIGGSCSAFGFAARTGAAGVTAAAKAAAKTGAANVVAAAKAAARETTIGGAAKEGSALAAAAAKAVGDHNGDAAKASAAMGAIAGAVAVRGVTQ